MKTIQITQGQVALVDDEDYLSLVGFKWHAQKGKAGNYYAARKFVLDGERTRVERYDIGGLAAVTS